MKMEIKEATKLCRALEAAGFVIEGCSPADEVVHLRSQFPDEVTFLVAMLANWEGMLYLNGKAVYADGKPAIYWVALKVDCAGLKRDVQIGWPLHASGAGPEAERLREALRQFGFRV